VSRADAHTPIEEQELSLATSYLDGVFSDSATRPPRRSRRRSANLMVYELPDNYFDDTANMSAR
jgi:hypothetical protein